MPSLSSFKALLTLLALFGLRRLNPSKQFDQSADVAAGQTILQRAVSSKPHKG